MMRLLPWDYAVRNLGRSPTRLALSVLGSTLVVLLVLAAGAFVRGMGRSMDVSAGADNVILLGAGSEESFERSEIPPVRAACAIRRNVHTVLSHRLSVLSPIRSR